MQSVILARNPTPVVPSFPIARGEDRARPLWRASRSQQDLAGGDISELERRGHL